MSNLETSAPAAAGAVRAIRGFYAILDRPDEQLAEALVAATGAGASVLQLRLKGAVPASTGALLAAARRVRALCHRHGALFIVNDRLDVALAAGADGVHLGQSDLPLSDARRVIAAALGPRASGFLVGISTHDLEQVRAAVAGGASYLGYGPVFATRTKRDPDPVQGLERLAAAVRAAAPVPVVAIGGIDPERAAAVAATGAHAACSIGAVNGSADPAAAGRALAGHWTRCDRQ